MKKILFLFLLISQTTGFAQQKEVNIHTSTTSGPQSRYEIVQSTLAARWTFRLDKYCGNIGQLVSTKDDGTAWESMIVIGLPKCLQDGKIRYQLFLSGLAARHTFLINTETGKTWIVRSGKSNEGVEYIGWFPFEN